MNESLLIIWSLLLVALTIVEIIAAVAVIRHGRKLRDNQPELHPVFAYAKTKGRSERQICSQLQNVIGYNILKLFPDAVKTVRRGDADLRCCSFWVTEDKRWLI